MDALNTAAAGLTAASNFFTADAQNLVKGGVDAPSAIADETSAKVAFNASAAVLRATAKMSTQLLDIFV